MGGDSFKKKHKKKVDPLANLYYSKKLYNKSLVRRFLLFVFALFNLTLQDIFGCINCLLEGVSLLLNTNVTARHSQCNHCDFVTLLVVLLKFQHYIDACSLFCYAVQLG